MWYTHYIVELYELKLGLVHTEFDAGEKVHIMFYMYYYYN